MDEPLGHFKMTSEALARRGPVHLEMDGVAPQTAGRVTINGQYAGGAIVKPIGLEISKHFHASKNTIRIEPFAPKEITLVVCMLVPSGFVGNYDSGQAPPEDLANNVCAQLTKALFSIVFLARRHTCQ